MSIAEIFNEKGEDYFRKIESELFIKISKKHNYVVSTGGGVVLDRLNRLALQTNGYTIFLNASPEILFARLKNNQKRPLLHGNDALFKLSQIWEVRKSFYSESANYIIDTDKLNPKQVIKLILKKIQ